MSENHSLQNTTPVEAPTTTEMGHGAMRLAGPNVFGEPRDRAEAQIAIAPS